MSTGGADPHVLKDGSTEWRLSPKHPAEFIDLTRRCSRNAKSFGRFQVIFAEVHISIENAILADGWVRHFWQEGLPTIPVQATPVTSGGIDYPGEAFSEAPGAQT
jgi:hypothetical protein